MIRPLAAAVAAALLLVACGDETDGRYGAQVRDARAAVEAGDRDAALASIEAVGLTALAAHAEGEVSDDELAELAALLDQARAQVDDELPAATTTPPPTTVDTTPPETAPPVVIEDSDDDDEKGEKKGKGRGGDDGDDDDDD